ncbi:MAG: NADPH-dependent glutamate synthase [Spirochaetes bacterium]|nr:NADPH-dependent glutamate synthase [Spirochaetota bacterium]
MAVNYKSVPMREQLPDIRRKNFDEVPLGYSEEEAVEEAQRCLQCPKAPCISGCPVNINIKGFIKHIQNREFKEAVNVIYESDTLPCVTGRVCPQEDQCQAKCVVGVKGEAVSIGRLERYVADRDLEQRANDTKSIEINENLKAAVIGSGPAGIACAADLAKAGIKVTVFEGFHKLGGVLVYGIPEFRLPKRIVETEIETLKKLGVEFIKDTLIGRALTIDNLFEKGYKGIFIASGAGLPKFMGIPGENANGVYSANEYLTRVNLMKAYKFPEYETPVLKGKSIAVIGGGNVAMDAARTAIRLGSEKVYLIYRRTEAEMPARLEEVHHAKEEGLIFKMLTNPVSYSVDDKSFVKKIECISMELGEPDSSGRRRPVPVNGSNFEIDIDVAIVAVGTTPNPLIAKTTPDLKIGKYGEIPVDENNMTNKPGVFAGGDIVTGAATVITAMGAGRNAAASMIRYFSDIEQ